MNSIIDLLTTQNRHTLSTIANSCSVSTTFISIILASLKGIKQIRKIYSQRSLCKQLKPFFIEFTMRRKTDNYIQTNYQNIDPARENRAYTKFYKLQFCKIRPEYEILYILKFGAFSNG